MIADEQTGEIMPIDGQRNQGHRGFEPLRRGVNHGADGGIFDANRADHTRQRAEPVRGVNHIRARDARE